MTEKENRAREERVHRKNGDGNGITPMVHIIETCRKQTNAHEFEKLGCLFEAFIGAMFLDLNKISVKDEGGWFENIFVTGPGFQFVQIFVENVFEKHVDWISLIQNDDNFKNILQVKIQKEFKVTPHYLEMEAHSMEVGYHMGCICAWVNPSIWPKWRTQFLFLRFQIMVTSISTCVNTVMR
jgi:hypothetical protein